MIPRTRRGYTLIEMMITVAVLGIGARLLVGAFLAYQETAHRARAVVAIAEALDQEMEAARACPTRACLVALTRSATTTAARPEVHTWVRPKIERQMRPGPDGTLEYRVTASIDDLVPPRTLTALLEAP